MVGVLTLLAHFSYLGKNKTKKKTWSELVNRSCIEVPVQVGFDLSFDFSFLSRLFNIASCKDSCIHEFGSRKSLKTAPLW